MHNRLIDLRSDTVTRPTPAMREAMARAEVGDDVYGEDPTVRRLEETLAERVGMAAGLFTSSGTQGNFLALLAHCARGDEYIVGQQAHCYRAEGGGAAALGGIQPQPLDFGDDGTLDLVAVESLIKPEDVHFARTRLLCLEDTHDGKSLPIPYLGEARALASRRGLAMHLDGARLFNAAVSQGVSAAEITRHFDSVSICLSKGLGAPAGTVLCGSDELIASARRWRKVVGGGMRQVGILAAGALHAIEHHVERLAEDHAKAAALAEALAGIDGLDVGRHPAQTNMVFVQPRGGREEAAAFLRERGILVGGRTAIRLVMHLDVDPGDVPRVVEGFAGLAETWS